MTTVETFRSEFARYKDMAEKAMAQLTDDQLLIAAPGGGNSIAVICWHVSGNLRSRFTDFLTSDGEKPWRQRDEEFEDRAVTRAELLGKWESGWSVLLATLASLTDADLEKQVTIRGQAHTVMQALVRALAHVCSHVGQIVYAARAFAGARWQTLSIAKGQSESFTRQMRDQSPPPRN